MTGSGAAPVSALSGALEVVVAPPYRPSRRCAPRAAGAAGETGLDHKTVAKAVEASDDTVQSKKANGLDGGGDFPHPAVKSAAKKSGHRGAAPATSLDS